jgi:hypothetical protein
MITLNGIFFKVQKNNMMMNLFPILIVMLLMTKVIKLRKLQVKIKPTKCVVTMDCVTFKQSCLKQRVILISTLEITMELELITDDKLICR